MKNKYKYSILSLMGSFLIPISLNGAVNEDEWYDPSDWFDGNNVEYEDQYEYGDYETNEFGEADTLVDTAGDPGYEYTYFVVGTAPSERNQWKEQKGSDSNRSETRSGGKNHNRYSSIDDEENEGSDLNTYHKTHDPSSNDRGYVRSSQNKENNSNYDYQANNNTGRNDSWKKNSYKDTMDHRTHDHMQVEGTVDGFSRVNLKKEDRDLNLIRVRMKDGQNATINLGSDTSVSDLNLEKGDKVKISGCKTQIDGKTLLKAQNIRVGEKTVKSRS